MIYRWAQMLLLLAAVGGSVAVRADEFAVRAALQAEAVGYLQNGDFDGFDRRATQLRSTRERTPGGIWKLYQFYKGTESAVEAPADSPRWDAMETRVAAYLQAHPDSPSAVILYGRLLDSHAWAWRGDGWARDLTQAQQTKFASYFQRARELLESHRAVAAVDPDWYTLEIETMNGLDADRQTILDVVRDAMQLEPTYEATLYVASTAMLPKWGGSQEWHQRFLDLVLASTSSQEGRQVYARVMFNIARLDPRPIQSLDEIGATWPELKASLAQITAAYPDPWNRNAERAVACLFGTQADFEAAQRRVGAQFVSVDWYDVYDSWPRCEQRQQEARNLLAPITLSFVQHLGDPQFTQPFIGGAALAFLCAVFGLYWLRRSRDAAMAANANSFFDSSSQPTSVYGLTSKRKLLKSLTTGLAAAAILIMLCLQAGKMDDSDGRILGLAAFVFVFVAMLTAAQIVDAFVSKLVLHANALEIISLWEVQLVRRDELASQALMQTRDAPRLVLRFKDPRRRPLLLPLVYQTDAQFVAWFRDVPMTDLASSLG